MCEAGFNVSVHVETTLDLDFIIQNATSLYCQRTSSSIPFTFRKHTESVGYGLTGMHRTYFLSKLDQYDMFIYTEDDVVISPQNIIAWLSERKFLFTIKGPVSDYRPGFIRINDAFTMFGEVNLF